MIVTNSGRPVERFPLIRLREGGKCLLVLSRVDVSDIGNETRAEAFYIPLVSFQSEDQMTTVEVRFGKNVLIIFIAPRKVTWHVAKPAQETEQ